MRASATATDAEGPTTAAEPDATRLRDPRTHIIADRSRAKQSRQRM